MGCIITLDGCSKRLATGLSHEALVYTVSVMRALRSVVVIGGFLAWTWCAIVTVQARHPGLSREAAAAETDPLIRVTAIVTDLKGQLLAGLEPADFELLVDGKPQVLETAELSTRAAAPRAFAFLLDEFHTAPEDSPALRESFLRFVDRHLRPEDLAFVVKPLDTLTAIAPSSDRDALRRAIATFEGRKGDFAPRTAFERDYMAQAPAAMASARGQIVTSALRAIGVTLSQTDNVRPAIVLVSDGFARMRGRRDLPANLQAAVRIANRADAPVYAFAPSPAAADDPDDAAPDEGITALRTLATQTGGELVVGAAAFERGLARMLRDLESHYVLTYRAPHGSDGRFHALQLGVKRKGAQVRARSGYVAPLSAEQRAALTPGPPAPPRILRRSSLIQSWSGLAPAQQGRTSVMLTWEPAPGRPGAPARARASTIVLTAKTPDGALLFDGPIGAAIDAATAEVPNRATFEAPSGLVLVDIKILDAKGVVLDTDARDVTVPRPRKDSPTIYPPAVIRARSAREFREAAQQAHAAPLASRTFRRTDRLLLRIPAVDASGAPVPVTATLLNRWRHPMRPIPVLQQPSAPPGLTQFALPLSSLAPGEYSVRFSVTHDGGSVSEHVAFRVEG